MAYLRFDDNVPHHVKMIKAGPAACWMWFCGVAYCQRHGTDGFLPAEVLPLLGLTVGDWRKYLPVLLAVHLFDQAEGGYRIHDFLDHNESAEERRQKTRDRNARVTRYRERAKRDGNALQDAEVTRTGNAPPTPTPTPTPTPVPAATRPSSLIRPRNLSAVFEHPRFDVPQAWHDKRVDGLNDGGFGMDAFYRHLSTYIEAHPDEDTEPRFEWLTGHFNTWVKARQKPPKPASDDIPSVEETRRRYLSTRS